MSRATEEIDCPNDPEHGRCLKRWLRKKYPISGKGDRNMPVTDVFEISCKICGNYEHHAARSGKRDAGEESVRKLMGR